MRRSRSVLVLSMTVFMVMAVAAVGLCGPPVGAGDGAGRAGAGTGPGGMAGMPSGDPGGQGGAGQQSGLTVTPGGGYGSAGGSGAGSPALLISKLGAKSQFISVQRASYYIPMPRMQSGIRIVGDAVNNFFTANGRYGTSSTPITYADARIGHTLDVKNTAGLYNLTAQVDYAPISASKNIKVGPSVGIQMYSDRFQVTDNTVSSLSSSRSHSATFITLGGWLEFGLPDMLGAAGMARASSAAAASPLQPKLYLAANGGMAKNWNSFNWEAMLSVFSVQRGSLWGSSRYGRYIPTLRTDIGYIAYYVKQSHQDTTSARYLNAEALVTGFGIPGYGTPGYGIQSNPLRENVDASFGAFVVRGNLAF